jgi:hypothetical protein
VEEDFGRFPSRGELLPERRREGREESNQLQLLEKVSRGWKITRKGEEER